MTQAEKDAIEEVRGILRLHFDAFVLTTRTNDDGNSHRIITEWRGDISDAIGMNRITQLRMEKVAVDGDGQPEVR